MNYKKEYPYKSERPQNPDTKQAIELQKDTEIERQPMSISACQKLRIRKYLSPIFLAHIFLINQLKSLPIQVLSRTKI